MVKNKSGLSREFIIHPGETLKEVLEERGTSQKELALRTGVTEAYVSSLKQIPEVSQVGAYRLETATSIDPYVLFTWLIMCDLITDDQKIEQELDTDKGTLQSGAFFTPKKW